MRLGLGLALLASVFCAQSTVYAEGSAELDVGDVVGTHDPHDQAVSATTELFVDIVDGTTEKICWRGNGAIAVYRPAPNQATVVDGDVDDDDCVDAIDNVNGAYRIVIDDDQDLGTEWDVRVCAKSVSDANCFGAANANERLGRLWSFNWRFEENGGNYGERYSINGSVYAIVSGGGVGRDAVIEMQMRGVSGAYYHLAANGIGPETTAGVRVGRSVAVVNHQMTPSLPLYLNPPSRALYNWITPTIGSARLTPSCGSGVVQGAAPGTISFNTNVTAQYVVVCDIDGDGAYNFGGTTDFSSFGTTVVGANTVTWNGTNNAGANVAAGTYNCIVRVNVGEFHYVAEDIETAFPGIRMYRIDTDRTSRVPIDMYWDDSGIAVDGENMPAPISALSPNTSPALGLAPGAYNTAATAFRYVGMANTPTGNARGWGNFDGDGKGNSNFLDQFSAAATAQSMPLRVAVFTNAADQDNDGLTNARECAIGTNPEDNDTDNDGVNDGFEATGSTTPNTDGDGLINALDPDDDGDGILTSVELDPGENGDGNPSDAANSDATGGADYLDVDSDNDGVCDGSVVFMGVCIAGPDVDRTDPRECRDTDNDNCDDCALTAGNGSGGNPRNDGTDSDADGMCNLTDPDDDDDGVCDTGVAVPNVCGAGPDTNPTNPNVCGDRDGDSCEDCMGGNGSTPMMDGTDTDNDGACNVGDPDDDNDGVIDGGDVAPLNPNRCRDTDNDTCDDCIVTRANNSGGNPANDGLDSDTDGVCDAGDPDDDNDGVCEGAMALPTVCVAGPDSAPLNPNVCLDRDNDTCNDCVSGTFAPGNDGSDIDSDGICDAGDPDDDDDGVCDGGPAVMGVCAGGPDTDPDDDNVCGDTDDDGCDDCVSGSVDPNDDGEDLDNDGQCDVNEDNDDDGAPDGVDLDDDNDGLLDSVEDRVGNLDQDQDGVPNRLDLDADNDGIADIFESGAFGFDENDDGMVDGPFGQNGYSDALETSADSGTSELGPIDTDGDGDEDFLDLDSDGDGRDDIAEVSALAGFDADGDGMLDSTVDVDLDGLMDVIDVRDDERGFPEPISDPRADDDDDDGIPQAYDLDDDGTDSGDSDGDGLSDGSECPSGWPCIDSDADGQPDYAQAAPTQPPMDSDGDGLTDDEECPSEPCRDSDDDDTPDYLDDDDDDDGILTITERTDEMSAGGDVDDDDIPAYLDLDSDGDDLLDEDEGVDDADDDDVPDYLDPRDPPVDDDTDDDGVPDVVECATEPCMDTDGDGMPDVNDPDDDDDGISTDDERPGDQDVDTDDDGTPDYLDPDDDDDGVPTLDEREDFDGNGIPDYLEAPREGTLAGGAWCSVSAPGGDDGEHTSFIPWLFALGALGFTWRRRGRGGSPKKVGSAAVVAALVTLLPLEHTQAQVALDQFKPAALPSDGFALSRPDALDEMQWALSLMLDYANDPLVYELRDPDEEREVVNDHLVLHAGAAVGVTERVTLFATLPVHLLMDGDDPGALAPEADGAGLGDMAFGGRFWLAGEAGSLASLSAELIARLPTATLLDTDQSYSGDRLGSLEPAFVAELRLGRFDMRFRPGVRLRQQRSVANLKLGSELVYGVGARLNLAEGLYAHVELFGSAMFAEFGDREHVPLELLIGAKYDVSGWYIGTAAGPGLTQGYGSPDLRWVLTASYAPKKEVEAPRTQPVTPQVVDSDGDGLLDPYDTCPQEPEDKDDFEDVDGCIDPDNDGDTIADVIDRCPMEAEDHDQFQDSDGCLEPDNDQDGIADVDDQCVMEPEDIDTFEDENGCPDRDNDQDSVPDIDDECPLVPGAIDARGCPKSVRLDVESGQIVMLDRVEFATGKDVILERSMPILEEVHRTLHANPQLTLVRVEGHTDDVGRDVKNMDLSQRRARSIARWLVEHGVEGTRLEAHGCGENRPLMPGKSAAARDKNRRVEFHIVQPSLSEPRNTEGCQPIAL